MVAIFAEDMVAAREYIKTTYPKSQKRGTFRLYNAEDKVCYEIVSMNNDNFPRNYKSAAYFNGSRLVKLNELISNFSEPEETEDSAEKPILTSTLEMPTHDTIPVWQEAFVKETIADEENE